MAVDTPQTIPAAGAVAPSSLDPATLTAGRVVEARVLSLAQGQAVLASRHGPLEVALGDAQVAVGDLLRFEVRAIDGGEGRGRLTLALVGRTPAAAEAATGPGAGAATAADAARALAAAVGRAAASQSGLAPLYATLAGLAASPEGSVPAPVRGLVDALMAGRLAAGEAPSAATVARAFEGSGLFFEARAVRGGPVAAGDDLKAGLGALREALGRWVGAGEAAGGSGSGEGRAAASGVGPAAATTTGATTTGGAVTGGAAATAGEAVTSGRLVAAAYGGAAAVRGGAEPVAVTTPVRAAVSAYGGRSLPVAPGIAGTVPSPAAVGRGGVAASGVGIATATGATTAVVGAPPTASGATVSAPTIAGPPSDGLAATAGGTPIPTATTPGGPTAAAAAVGSVPATGEGAAVVEPTVGRVGVATATAGGSGGATATPVEASAATAIGAGAAAVPAIGSGEIGPSGAATTAAAAEVSNAAIGPGAAAPSPGGGARGAVAASGAGPVPAGPGPVPAGAVGEEIVAASAVGAMPTAGSAVAAGLGGVAAADGAMLRAATAAAGTLAGGAAVAGRAGGTERERGLRPPPPRRGQPLGGQPALAVDSGADGVEGLGRRALERTEGALSRILLEQYAAMAPRVDEAAAPEAVGRREWTAELPLATANGTAVVQMSVERDGGGTDKPEAKAVGWRVRFALDVEPIGPVHAQIGLGGEHLSIGLWIERPGVAEQLGAAIGELRGALEAADIPVEAIHVATGRPPEGRGRGGGGSGHFVDVSL